MFFIWVRSLFPYKYENNKPKDRDDGNDGTPGPQNPTPSDPMPSDSYQPASFGDNIQ
jgi:multidrug efflux pump